MAQDNNGRFPDDNPAHYVWVMSADAIRPFCTV
jgi:hypothetical protein